MATENPPFEDAIPIEIVGNFQQSLCYFSGRVTFFVQPLSVGCLFFIEPTLLSRVKGWNPTQLYRGLCFSAIIRIPINKSTSITTTKDMSLTGGYLITGAFGRARFYLLGAETSPSLLRNTSLRKMQMQVVNKKWPVSWLWSDSMQVSGFFLGGRNPVANWGRGGLPGWGKTKIGPVFFGGMDGLKGEFVDWKSRGFKIQKIQVGKNPGLLKVKVSLRQ